MTGRCPVLARLRAFLLIATTAVLSNPLSKAVAYSGALETTVKGNALVFYKEAAAVLRKTARLFAGFALLALVSPYVSSEQQTASAQTPSTKPTMAKEMGAAPKLTNAQKIALAMSAGPAEIAKHATIMDMPDPSTGKATQLRAGTNGWVCDAMIDEPDCLDKEWQKWMDAWASKREPKIERAGIGYMLRGDKGASNTDPYATAATADNQWVVAPPHIMVLYQDLKMLDAYPADWKGGGPWVMWKGTPYAHLMVPVSPTKAAR